MGFYQAIQNDIPLPEFTWTYEPDGSIRVVTTSGSPTSVLLWQANNPDARDFRLQTIGAAWTSVSLIDQGGGVFVGHAPAGQGYNAYFVELNYGSLAPDLLPVTFTTSVYVVPEPISLTILLSGLCLFFVRRINRS
jgi:PhoPQ-activated pathogenicity-related protein